MDKPMACHEPVDFPLPDAVAEESLSAPSCPDIQSAWKSCDAMLRD